MPKIEFSYKNRQQQTTGLYMDSDNQNLSSVCSNLCNMQVAYIYDKERVTCTS